MEMKEYKYHDVHFRGTIDRVTYETHNPEGQLRQKYANVYLPYGYDSSDKAKKYDILYIMHGGGGNPDAWLDCCKIKNMLDYSIDAKEVQPLIVVFPSFYKEAVCRVGAPDAQFENQKVKEFIPELLDELMPAVESKYNVYAENVTDEGLRASRNHRGFGGFSMGSCTTWYVLLEKISYFSKFLPLSGDCWAVRPQGGGNSTQETAEYIRDSILSSSVSPSDFNIFAATGSDDIAYKFLSPQIEAMKKFTDVFSYSDDAAVGNLHYFVAPGQVHAYEAVCNYLYTYFPYLFV